MLFVTTVGHVRFGAQPEAYGEMGLVMNCNVASALFDDGLSSLGSERVYISRPNAAGEVGDTYRPPPFRSRLHPQVHGGHGSDVPTPWDFRSSRGPDTTVSGRSGRERCCGYDLWVAPNSRQFL